MIGTDNRWLELGYRKKSTPIVFFPGCVHCGVAEKGPLKLYSTRADSRGEITNIADQFCCVI